jgi:hypothetical protein
LNHSAHQPLLESLERRQLLSTVAAPLAASDTNSSGTIHQALGAAVNLNDGTYSGTANVTLPDGSTAKVNTDVSLKTDPDGVTRVKFKIRVGFLTLKPNLKVILKPSSNGFVIGVIPPKDGGGIVQIQDGKSMTVDGNINTGEFGNIPYSFSGTKTSSGAAPLAESVTTQATKNPILGTYAGSITNSFTKKTWAVKVQVVLDSLGRAILHSQTTISADLEVDVDTRIHPKSDGSFQQQLAKSPLDGIVSGRLTPAGHFVFSIAVFSAGTTSGTKLNRLT